VAGLAAAMEPGSTYDASAHVANYVLHRGGQAVALLEWRVRGRASAGRYLRRRARPARRLAVDVGLDALAGDALEDRLSRDEWAQAAAALSLPLALDAADRALRGGLPAAPSRPLEPGVYELHVTGQDAATLALACPSLRVTRAGDTSVIGGVLDDAAMRTLIRRVNLLGARVLAIFREVPHRAHHRVTSAAGRPGG
jgi:hypothetical protein